jgi:hypothetical protein
LGIDDEGRVVEGAMGGRGRGGEGGESYMGKQKGGDHTYLDCMVPCVYTMK